MFVPLVTDLPFLPIVHTIILLVVSGSAEPWWCVRLLVHYLRCVTLRDRSSSLILVTFCMLTGDGLAVTTTRCYGTSPSSAVVVGCAFSFSASFVPPRTSGVWRANHQQRRLWALVRVQALLALLASLLPGTRFVRDASRCCGSLTLIYYPHLFITDWLVAGWLDIYSSHFNNALDVSPNGGERTPFIWRF